MPNLKEARKWDPTKEIKKMSNSIDDIITKMERPKTGSKRVYKPESWQNKKAPVKIISKQYNVPTKLDNKGVPRVADSFKPAKAPPVGKTPGYINVKKESIERKKILDTLDKAIGLLQKAVAEPMNTVGKIVPEREPETDAGGESEKTGAPMDASVKTLMPSDKNVSS